MDGRQIGLLDSTIVPRADKSAHSIQLCGMDDW